MRKRKYDRVQIVNRVHIFERKRYVIFCYFKYIFFFLIRAMIIKIWFFHWYILHNFFPFEHNISEKIIEMNITLRETPFHLLMTKVFNKLFYLNKIS